VVQAAFPGDDLPDLGRPGEHGDHDIARLGDLTRGAGDLGPLFTERLGLRPGAVVDHEVEDARQQV
jgi:hypothetical protein